MMSCGPDRLQYVNLMILYESVDDRFVNASLSLVWISRLLDHWFYSVIDSWRWAHKSRIIPFQERRKLVRKEEERNNLPTRRLPVWRHLTKFGSELELKCCCCLFGEKTMSPICVFFGKAFHPPSTRVADRLYYPCDVVVAEKRERNFSTAVSDRLRSM